jgi:vanillate O-demethylase monooxygenase subunit
MILEAQQRAIEAHPGRDFNNLSIDSGSVRMRRILDGMIEAEAQPAGAS